MYSFFTSTLASVATFPQLPKELWCCILRMLASDTLLAISNSSAYIDHIIRGHSVLRQRIEAALQQETNRYFKIFTDPRSAIQITRERPNAIYETNCRKVCTMKSSCFVKPNVLEKKNYKKTSHYISKRFVPYRI
ncbi:hypothetical protein GWI33_014744 [Rhynchophorus ferrugineus]|uniref:F-box domain-containing protein n=1 Tax=Rhynchophorus ferrugineus TaxID=354439 RepID=A0A834I6Q8_RHYFE|nr:hypothetical protein GWI33_014744 [Rhynchophorus ferrugineus]